MTPRLEAHTLEAGVAFTEQRKAGSAASLERKARSAVLGVSLHPRADGEQAVGRTSFREEAGCRCHQRTNSI